MKTGKKASLILLNLVPILVMIGLIRFIKNDYFLSITYLVIILISLAVKYEKNDYLFLLFGLIGMMISEFLFIRIGVEIFNRDSLFGLMPLWLPILWAYAFVAIRRTTIVLNK